MFNNKPIREKATINGSSMADIAFLLLIFFLVTTTINVDTGISLVLPPPIQDDRPQVHERNLMNILVNADGLIRMDDKPVLIEKVKPILREFINNKGKDPEQSDSPQKAIISLKTQRETPYKVYIDMLDEVMGTYKQLRNEASISEFGIEFKSLVNNTSQKQLIIKMYPKNFSVAESSEN
ncbi:MAG TPA: biopolymer transporter ExbD [Balneola sp.]|nr:biopolymer transporter ExbD [Balneola sp.]